MATGAAVACPDRKVLSLQADGSAMYTIQSLWTQARENLDVTTVLLNDRSYAILRIELANVGAQNIGRKALDMLDLSRPDLDFVRSRAAWACRASAWKPWTISTRRSRAAWPSRGRIWSR